MLAGHRHRLAILEHGARRADLAHGVDKTADHLEGGLAAAEHERGRIDRADGAHDALRRKVEREQQGPEAGAAQAQLECLHVERLQVEARARVEEQNTLWPAGGRHHAARRVQPSRGPAAAELALGVAALALVGELDGRQEHLLHGALHRAHGEALLEHAVGHALVEVVEGVEQPRGGRGALATLAGELDGRRDVVGLEQRPAKRLELGEVVLAMAALRPARLGVAEAAFPAPEGVGAHPEQLGGGVGPDPAHMTSKSTDRVSVAALLPTSPPRFRGVETLCTGL